MFEFRPIEALAALPQPMLSPSPRAARPTTRRFATGGLRSTTCSAREAAAGLSAPDVRRFAGAGHNLMRYRPAELTTALTDLLESGGVYQRS